MAFCKVVITDDIHILLKHLVWVTERYYEMGGKGHCVVYNGYVWAGQNKWVKSHFGFDIDLLFSLVSWTG